MLAVKVTVAPDSADGVEELRVVEVAAGMISSAGFAAAVRGYFERELEDSKWISPDLHKRRATTWRRVKWAISHFLVNMLDYTVTRRLNFRAER